MTEKWPKKALRRLYESYSNWEIIGGLVMSRFDQQMREKIENELISLNRWIAALNHESWFEDLEMGGDNTPLSEEADAAEKSEEQEIRFEMLERLTAKANRLEEALHRFPEGNYGICTSCGKPIHAERLEALPEAAFCLSCQKQQERAEQSPHTLITQSRYVLQSKIVSR